jgi:hypothetical protein
LHLFILREESRSKNEFLLFSKVQKETTNEAAEIVKENDQKNQHVMNARKSTK